MNIIIFSKRLGIFKGKIHNLTINITIQVDLFKYKTVLPMINNLEIRKNDTKEHCYGN